MTSSCVCCASSPVLAIHQGADHGDLSLRWGCGATQPCGEQLVGALGVAVGRLQHLHVQVVLPGEVDHLDHRGDGVDVALLERAGGHADVRVGRDARRRASGTGRRRRGPSSPRSGLTSFSRPTRSRSAPSGRDRCADTVPSARDRDLRIRRNDDRPALAQHRQAGPRLELALGADPEAAAAGVGLAAVQRLHREEAVALDRDVEVAAGLLDRAGRQVGARRRRQRVGATRQTPGPLTWAVRNAVVSAL